MPRSHSLSQPNRHMFNLFLACTSVVLTLAVARPANAQGTMGTVPDPISSRELEDYAERLGLSPQQRQAIESLHDQYRAEFTQLRERDIEKFLSENRGMGGGPMGGLGMLTDRKAVEKSLRELDDIQNKIKAVDNRLFDQLQTVLTEEQMAKLPQARQARERVRYRSGLSRLTAFMNPAAQVDLSEFVSDLSLSAQEQEAVAPLIQQYESSLTSGARKLFESTNSMILDGLDAIQKQTGVELTEDAMRDPERRGRVFQAMRGVMGELQKKLAAKSGELSDLNRRTLRSVTASLSAEHARSLRDQFYSRAYPEISAGNRGGRSAARALELVVKFKDPGLTDEQNQVAATLTTEFFASLDRLAEQAMDAIDENRKTQSFFDFDEESRRKFQEQISALRDKRTSLNENTMASLRAALSPEQIERLDKRLADGGAGEDVVVEGQILTIAGAPGMGTAISVARADRSGAAEGEDGAAMSDPYIPRAISKRDVEDYATRLNLAADDLTVLTSLHGDYMEKFAVVEGDQIKAARDAERQLWAVDASTGQMQPRSPQAIDDLYSLRKKAMDAVTVLDQQFFDDVQIAVGDEAAPKVQRLRSARQRQLLARAGGGGAGAFLGAMPAMRVERDDRGDRRGQRGDRGGMAMRFMGAGGGGDASVDLSALVDSLHISAPTDPAQFDAALLEYEQAALAAFQKMYETNLRMSAARDKMMSQSIRIEGGRENRTVQIGDGMRSMMENEGRAAGEARRAVTDLNKSTLPRLMGALASGDAQSLRRAYHQKAFPQVFNDSSSAEPHLKAAMNLGAMSEQQRAAVQELAMEYRGQYDQICEKLIELEESALDVRDLAGGGRGGRDGGGWQNFQEQMRTREKIEFDRNDLNDKTITRLRGVLNEQQIRELGLDRSAG